MCVDFLYRVSNVFQSTRPRGARRQLVGAVATGSLVSIHAPARGATQPGLARIDFRYCFNPRAREGRDKAFTLRFTVCPSFNPRAREGRDGQRLTDATFINVSIHAPARGATLERLDKPEAVIVSIHAPARGATIPDNHIRGRSNVSIHAPARGATFPV